MEELVNQENVTSRFAAESALVEQAKIVQKRAALGELGNRLPIFLKITNGTLTQSQATCPANGHTLAQAKPKQTMPSPQAAAKNVTSRFAAKYALVEQAKIVQNRAALGGLANRLPIFQKITNGTLTQSQATCPANGHTLAQAKPKQTMPSPQAAAKKNTKTSCPFEESKKIPEKIVNVAAKPEIERKESILNNIIADKGKTSSRETLKSYSAKQLAIIDPDEDSKNDPAMVTEYLEDIFNYLRSLETKFSIREDFLEGHETTVWMRATLVNWLVEVHMKFELYLETLHLCVAIVDTYLQKNKHVGRNSLQLVGTTAMLVASKYEETYIPNKYFVCICKNTFSKTQILTMERDILKDLDFSLGRPLSVHFLRRYNKIAQARTDHHTLGEFMLELSLLEYEMSSVNPSLQAAAACCLSMGILNDVMDLAKLWTPTLVHYTKYEYSEFKDVIVSLANILVKSESSEFQTIRKKYSSFSYNMISLNPKLQGVLVKKLAASNISTINRLYRYYSSVETNDQLYIF